MKQTENQKGFTLIEVLVALTILAVAAMGLMTVSGQSLRQSHDLEEKTLALIIAQNTLARLHAIHAWPPGGSDSETVNMGGRVWKVTIHTQSTPRADMQKVNVEVTVDGTVGSVPLAALTGYMGKH